MHRHLLEICCANLQSCEHAALLNIERIELCSALELGGLSPSVAFTKQAKKLQLNTMVLIRPRSGDFYFSPKEKELMISEMEEHLVAGCDGLVVGALKERRLDLDFLSTIRNAFPSTELCVHRAIDESDHYEEDLQALVDLRFERVLSSGKEKEAWKASAFLGEMQLRHPQIKILAGGGVRPKNAIHLLNAGIQELHFSASKSATHHHQHLFEGHYKVSDSSLIAEMQEVMENYSKR